MYTKNFSQLTKKDADIAGGKGASLGEMEKNKMPVPPGFVILASAFERFLQETDLDIEINSALKKINFDEMHSVTKASEVIRNLIKKRKMPEDIKKEVFAEFKKLKNAPFNKGGKGGFSVAVRSSATAEDSSSASWAGELETYLDTTEKCLIENIENCWSSLFTPRAIFYRHEKKMLNTKVSVAVVIQKMIESEISGITFTVHPVTEDKRQMIIEAGWGLGEAIVSGQITPDSYVLDKKDFSIIDINISKQDKMIVRKSSSGVKHVNIPKAKQEKQKLTGKQIVELAKICLSIEKHYHKPQDIEWAFANGKFYITQSRPITTL